MTSESEPAGAGRRQRHEIAWEALQRAEAMAGLTARPGRRWVEHPRPGGGEPLASVTSIGAARRPERSRERPRQGELGDGELAPWSPAHRLATPSDLAILGPAPAPGQVVSVLGSHAGLLALASATVGEGWCALAGLPDLGLLAAAQLGLPLERTVVVPQLGSTPVRILAGLIDGMDVVVAGPLGIGVADANRLAARLRRRGAVLLTSTPWPGSSATVVIDSATWEGMERGLGYARLTGMDARLERDRGWRTLAPAR